MRFYLKLSLIVGVAVSIQFGAIESAAGQDVWLGLRWKLACERGDAVTQERLCEEALRQLAAAEVES